MEAYRTFSDKYFVLEFLMAVSFSQCQELLLCNDWIYMLTNIIQGK